MNNSQRSLHEKFACELLARMTKDDAVRVVMLLTRDKPLIEAAAAALRDALIDRLQDSARDNNAAASNSIYDLTVDAANISKEIIFGIECNSFRSRYLARMIEHCA